MELSRPVVVQHHGHLTLTLDFQGQIFKMLYLRNRKADWHGTKGMWVDRMLHPLCDFQCSPHPWPWPWIFKVKFWKSHISGMGWLIDMELKGCESIECWTHVVTFNVHLAHDFDLGFSGSTLKMLSLRNVRADWHGKKAMSVNRMLHPLCDFQFWPQLWPWPWIFKVKFWKKSYLRNGMADWHGIKGMWVDRMLDSCCDFQLSPHLWPWPWIFKVKLWKCYISGMGGPIDMEQRGCESIGC